MSSFTGRIFPVAASPFAVAGEKRRDAASTLCLLFVAALLFAGEASAQTFDFSNIKYWVGSGSNQAAVVVAWNDGKTPDSLVWGYRWNGANPTFYSVLQAIQSVDFRFLFTPVPNFPGTVYSVFFDLTGSGGTPVVGKPHNETGYPPYPGDHYKEGWFSGCWENLTSTGNPFISGYWSVASTGFANTTCTNNCWYGMSYLSPVTYQTGTKILILTPPGFANAVSIPTLTFQQWESRKSFAGNAADAPLNDGIPNLLKYLYNINPTRTMTPSDRSAMPALGTTTLSGTAYLTLSYRQNQYLTGTTVNVQFSTDLQNWATVTPDFSQQTGVDAITGDPLIQVGVHVTAATGNYLRLNVTSQ